MKIKELKELEGSKLQKALEDAKKDLIQLGKSSKKRNVRRQIARMLTIMNERKKGIAPKARAMSEAHGIAHMDKKVVEKEEGKEKEEKNKKKREEGKKEENKKEKTVEKSKQKKEKFKNRKEKK